MNDRQPARRRARNASAPRSKRVNLSFNESEYKIVMLAAERDSLSPGAYAARTTLAVARGELIPLPADYRDRLRTLAHSRVAVNRIGNNLNQIAAVLNSDGEVPPAQLAAVLERVSRAVETLDAATLATMEQAE
ncbi:plasmid mobilization relaxosome protein MobC [Streptomyces platensis]|uniref:plasmid mobilization relaxosome protein MobC n=1 Tax=Streptomyces platensis TaxID=58346 RepID=UPI00332F2BB8